MAVEMERKRLPFELKAGGAEGEFSAVFATFDVVDLDGDVTRPGAFAEGEEVIVGSWGHKTYELPVGKGVIQSNQREASVAGAFFLDTEGGKDTYQTVKNLGALGEWSYVFTVRKQSFGQFDNRDVRFLEDIEVWSVDPVLKGAGIDTRTTRIKEFTRGLSFLEHVAEVAGVLEEFRDRVKERVAVREKEGRVLSASNVERLAGIAESLKSCVGDLEKLLESAQPKSDELAREYIRYQRILAGLPA